jgi:hypothetical protein
MGGLSISSIHVDMESALKLMNRDFILSYGKMIKRNLYSKDVSLCRK